MKNEDAPPSDASFEYSGPIELDEETPPIDSSSFNHLK
jgi:hypothetical protein